MARGLGKLMKAFNIGRNEKGEAVLFIVSENDNVADRYFANVAIILHPVLARLKINYSGKEPKRYRTPDMYESVLLTGDEARLARDIVSRRMGVRA